MSHIEKTLLRAIGDAEKAREEVEREYEAGSRAAGLIVPWSLYRYASGFAVGVYETALEFPLIARSATIAEVKKRLDVLKERDREFSPKLFGKRPS